MLLSLHMEPALLITMITVLGFCVGSFLNVVIVRLPEMIAATEMQISSTLLFPASHCPHCKHPIRWYHNIPLFSYWWLHRRCYDCHHRISARYFWIELFTGVISGILAYYCGFTVLLLALLLLTWILLPLMIIDWQTQLLPDPLSLSLLWLGLLFNVNGLYVPLSDAVWGAVAGYVSLWFIMQLYKAITGKWGMGYGDFKLFSALGAWAGWQSLPLILAIAACAGIVIGLVWLKKTHQPSSAPIAFGPFLAIAGWVVIVVHRLC